MLDADPEIGLIVLIGDVPAKRTKVTSLLNQSMEETQAKKEPFPFML